MAQYKGDYNVYSRVNLKTHTQNCMSNHCALKQREVLRTRGYIILQEAERRLTFLVGNQKLACGAPDQSQNSLHVLHYLRLIIQISSQPFLCSLLLAPQKQVGFSLDVFKDLHCKYPT